MIFNVELNIKNKNMFQTIITDFFTKKNNCSQLTNIYIEKNSYDFVINLDTNKTKTYGHNENTGNWHCLECGDNMGDNPRQLCGKSYCYNNC